MALGGDGANTVTFGIPGRVIFDMDLGGAPLPPGVHPPNWLGATFSITCTEAQAEAMESWLRANGTNSQEYRAAAEVIRRTLQEANRIEHGGDDGTTR
jgi:hypothetical protein